MIPLSFKYLTTSPEISRLAVMLHIRFPLSPRNIEDFLHERSIDASRETVRYRWNIHGPSHIRYHECLQTLTPADVNFERGEVIPKQSDRIERQTIEMRRLHHRKTDALSNQPNEPDPLLAQVAICRKIPDDGRISFPNVLPRWMPSTGVIMKPASFLLHRHLDIMRPRNR